MIILPSSEAPPISEDLLSEVLQDSVLAQANSAFLASSRANVPRSQPSLYVHQAECASVAYAHEPADLHIGSDDATTCLILAARCRVTQRAFVSHHDNSTIGVPDDELLGGILEMQQPEVYLVGAFKEPEGYSEEACHRILMALHSHPRPFKIVLACIWSSNFVPDTQGPATRGVALHCASGKARPAGFDDRGPHIPRRMAKGTCTSSGQREEEEQGGRLVQLAKFDTPGKLHLPGFSARVPSWLLMNIRRMLEKPDSHFLSCSTSPEHEAPHFVSDMRASFAWILKAQDERGDPQDEVYERVKEGEEGWKWVRV